MYHVSAQGVDERVINVHYYYYVSQQPYQSVVDLGGTRHGKETEDENHKEPCFLLAVTTKRVEPQF